MVFPPLPKIKMENLTRGADGVLLTCHSFMLCCRDELKTVDFKRGTDKKTKSKFYSPRSSSSVHMRKAIQSSAKLKCLSRGLSMCTSSLPPSLPPPSSFLTGCVFSPQARELPWNVGWRETAKWLQKLLIVFLLVCTLFD